MTRAFLSIGFRPFYLAAAVFAAVAIPAWFAAYRGWLVLGAPLPGMAWHAHEMVFGFAPAVISGFLLTAVRNWTGRPTPAGGALAALVGLWLAGRVLQLTGPALPAALLDVAFLPTVAAVLAVPLWQSGNRRNAFVVPLLLTLGALSAAHHGAYLGWADGVWASRAITVALDLIALLLTVIGGRVIPAFSANAIPGLRPRRWPVIEALAIGALLVIVLLEVSGLAARLPQPGLRALFAAAGVIHLVRLAGWQPWATRGNVLLLVLPLGYLWVPLHLLLRAGLDGAGGQMAPLALHALTVGAMAGLMLAMMTRSALGHTGRPLVAGPWERVMFLAIHLGAASRVLGPLAWPGAYPAWIAVSAVCWTVAFAAFATRYLPIVSRPRADVAAL